MPPQENRIRYTYVKDPQEPRRVLAIARVRTQDPNIYKYTVAQNVVKYPTILYSDELHRPLRTAVYDTFSKKMAHQLLSARLEKGRKIRYIDVAPGASVIASILKDLSEDKRKEWRHYSKTAARAIRVARTEPQRPSQEAKG